MEIQKSPFVYIGAKSCGCVVAIHSETDPYPQGNGKAWKRELAKCIADWIKEGYSVTRVSKEEGCRLINLNCTHSDSVALDQDAEMPLLASAE